MIDQTKPDVDNSDTKLDQPNIYSQKELRLLLIFLGIVAVVVLVFDAIMFAAVGSVASNALSATFAGIGGILMMLGATSKMGLTKWEWRDRFLAVGGLLVGLGGAGVAWAAWLASFEQLGH